MRAPPRELRAAPRRDTPVESGLGNAGYGGCARYLTDRPAPRRGRRAGPERECEMRNAKCGMKEECGVRIAECGSAGQGRPPQDTYSYIPHSEFRIPHSAHS